MGHIGCRGISLMAITFEWALEEEQANTDKQRGEKGIPGRELWWRRPRDGSMDGAVRGPQVIHQPYRAHSGRRGQYLPAYAFQSNYFVTKYY